MCNDRQRMMNDVPRPRPTRCERYHWPFFGKLVDAKGCGKHSNILCQRFVVLFCRGLIPFALTSCLRPAAPADPAPAAAAPSAPQLPATPTQTTIFTRIKKQIATNGKIWIDIWFSFFPSCSQVPALIAPTVSIQRNRRISCDWHL